MIPPHSRVLAAVSGGLDSVSLLDALHTLSSQLSFELSVGHVDHGLRGAASAQDAEFVRSLARRYDLSFFLRRLSAEDVARRRDQGREGAAREARLAALQDLAVEAKADRIALGHTLDDQAETLLERLARGTGPTGMMGIPLVRGPFIRPLLQTPRTDVLAYATRRSLCWRDDASNADLDFARNRIRHRVLPELRRVHPEAAAALGRAAGLFADLNQAVSYWASQTLESWSGDREEGLPLDELGVLPDPVLRLVLREQIRRVRGTLDGIEFAHVEAVRSLVRTARSHGECSLPRLHVRVQGGRMAFSAIPPAPPAAWELSVDVGETLLPGRDAVLELEILPQDKVKLDDVRSDPWSEAADADCVSFPMTVRTRRPGDRFRPLGSPRTVKLKDFLINQRTPTFDRDEIPLLCSGDRIVWVAGVRLSDTVRVSNGTRRVLLMRIKGVRP